MCLYCLNKKPLVSNKDLIVYKKLIRTPGGFSTPYMKTEVKLGENMVAEGKMPKLPEEYGRNETITDGVIHSYSYLSYFCVEFNDVVYAKAVIKAGTPFFVGNYGKEVASRELFITDEIAGWRNFPAISADLGETRRVICEILRGEKATDDGIRIGDVLLSDMTYRTPDEITDCMDIIGIVGFIRGDEPYVIALEQAKGKWHAHMGNKPYSCNTVIDDYNGEEYTKKLREKNGKCLYMFPVFDYCSSYHTHGTEKGDWYLPSTEEMRQVVINSLIINETVGKIGYKAYNIEEGKLYWTSAEADCTTAWACSTLAANIVQVTKYIKNYVRPMFHPSKQKDKTNQTT